MPGERQHAQVLLMYSRVGGGHLSAARALVAELEATGRCTARAGRRLRRVRPLPGHALSAASTRAWRAAIRACGRWSTTAAARRAGSSRSWVVGPFLRRGLQRAAARRAARRGRSASCPRSTGCSSKQRDDVGARLEVVLTDWHSVHPFWVAPGVDHYTAPTDSARAGLHPLRRTARRRRRGGHPGAARIRHCRGTGIAGRASDRASASTRRASRCWPWSAPRARRARWRTSPRWRSSDLDAQLRGRVRPQRGAARAQSKPCQRACRCARSGFVDNIGELMRSGRPAGHQGRRPDAGRGVLLRRADGRPRRAARPGGGQPGVRAASAAPSTYAADAG